MSKKNVASRTILFRLKNSKKTRVKCQVPTSDIPVIGSLALSPGVKEPRLHKLRAPDDIIPYSIAELNFREETGGNFEEETRGQGDSGRKIEPTITLTGLERKWKPEEVVLDIWEKNECIPMDRTREQFTAEVKVLSKRVCKDPNKQNVVLTMDAKTQEECLKRKKAVVGLTFWMEEKFEVNRLRPSEERLQAGVDVLQVWGSGSESLSHRQMVPGPEIIEIPDTQPQFIEIPDTQPQIIEILDTQPIKTIEIPDTQQILDSVLENNFGMDSEFGDTSLLDFFNNKSGESENIDVDVNDHRDENLDHYSEIVINDLYNQCQLDSNDQGVHDDDYGDLIPTFDENLLNSEQLIDRHQMHDNNYDCQRLVDVENKRSEMRDQECNSCARPGKSRIPSPPPNTLNRKLLKFRIHSPYHYNSRFTALYHYNSRHAAPYHSVKTIEIPDTQQILDSVLENDFGMDEQFRDTSLKRLLDFFDNKSGESENVDVLVVVNDHRDENLDHYSEVVINDHYEEIETPEQKKTEVVEAPTTLSHP
ncbi:hypothetical protein GEV33_004295 [Tenebrio molitor]|uniref:Uncharacterized protein n=1 Tax=Tenebrio molitor TaxID=7067 RepID=A0A8J6LMU9_TENMO|nr:hypothetical protein GEV33_004295 [Tenebrio molitor]